MAASASEMGILEDARLLCNSSTVNQVGPLTISHIACYHSRGLAEATCSITIAAQRQQISPMLTAAWHAIRLAATDAIIERCVTQRCLTPS